MNYSPVAAARSHVLADLAADATRRVKSAQEALQRAEHDHDRAYLREIIKTAQGYADRLRASPGFVVEG